VLRLPSRPNSLLGGILAAFIAVTVSAPGASGALILHYDFDDGSGTVAAADSSGFAPAANGTFVNDATRTTSGSTPNGTGYAQDLSVNAVSDWVASAGATKLDTLTNFTLTCWVNMRAAPVNGDRLCGRIAATPFPGFDFFVGTPNAGAIGAGNFKLGMLADTSTATASTADMGASNEWKFVAVTYDGNLTSLNVLFYSGGTTNAVTQLGNAGTRNSGTINTTTAEFRVGGTQSTTADRTPPAWIDDVRVYNTVLSAQDLELVRREISNLPAEPTISSFTSSGQSGYVTGGSNLSFSVTASGQAPLTFGWIRNGAVMPDGIVTTNAAVATLGYALGSAIPEHAGDYVVVVTNASGSVTSGVIALDITTIFNTEVMTNIWTVAAGSVTYLGTGNSERGIAYSPVSSNYSGGSLIVPHYASLGNRSIQVVNPADGATGPVLAMTDGATFDMTNGVRGINMARAGSDGAIYVGSLTTSASVIPYYLYRYSSDDSATVLPTIAYTGDPGGASFPGLRWGENMAIRGAGASTEILIAPSGGLNIGTNFFTWETNIVALLQSANGSNYSATVIQITNAPASFATLGLAFGPGTNTFYGKNRSKQLYLVEFDVNAGFGSVQQTYSLSAVPECVTGIGTDATGALLGAVSVETPDTFRLYSVADTTRDPELLDQEAFTVDNPNTTGGGLGAVAFGTNGNIYVLDSANGIKAFQPDTNYTQPSAFSISSIVPDSNGAAVSWPGQAGRTYQVQSRDLLTAGAWSRAGLPALGNGATVSVTNLFLGTSVTNRFYRVVGQ
jgi:hypothetical protein